MYNGIGLQTARGSGTSGHVQTNRFNARRRNQRHDGGGGRDWRGEREGGSGGPGVRRKPNEEILEHERKRKIELEVFKLRDDLEEEGKLSEEEIEKRVGELRAKLEAGAARGERGRPGRGTLSQGTHAVADRKARQMANLARALRVNPDLKEGEAFDREAQEQKRRERDELRDQRRREAEARSEARRREREAATGGRGSSPEPRGSGGTTRRSSPPPKKRSRCDRSPSQSYSYSYSSYSYSSEAEGKEERKSPEPRGRRERSQSYSYSYSYSRSPSR